MTEPEIRRDAPPEEVVSVAPEAAGIAVRDEEDRFSEPFITAVRKAVAEDDGERLRELAGPLHEADLAELIEALPEEEQSTLVRLLGPDFDFAALTELDEAVRARILEVLPPEQVAEGLGELDTDDAVYILEDLDEEEQAAILSRLSIGNRIAVARSLDYPEESAGRRMQSDFIAVPPFWTVGQTIDYMREAEELPDEFYEIYVVDPGFRLIGTVPLNRLLRAKRPVKMQDILDPDPHRIEATEDQEEAARLFERYNLVAAAVVDQGGRLVGVITIDDIVDVIQEEASEDILALGGVVGDEEISDTVLTTARSRLPWLAINAVTAGIAACVIGLFDATIEQMVALAVLMPIVASMAGNAGTQTMTVTVRALAMRSLGGRARRVLLREALVGCLNGILLAAVIGGIAGFWFANAQLGGIIAAALVINMIVAGFFGVLIPFTFEHLGIDPAVASGVFLTTVTDVVGYFSFLALAAWWFGLAL